MSDREFQAQQQAFLRDFLAAARSHGLQSALTMTPRLCDRHGLSEQDGRQTIEAHLQQSTAEAQESARDAAALESQRIAAEQLRLEIDRRLERNGFLSSCDMRWAGAFARRSGLPTTEADRVLAECNDAHKALRGRERRRRRRRGHVMTLAITIAAIAAVGYGLYRLADSQPAPWRAGPRKTVVETTHSDAWWGPSLTLALDKLLAASPDDSHLKDRLRSGRAAERADGYRSLKTLTGQSAAQARLVDDILVEACVREPADENRPIVAELLLDEIPGEPETAEAARPDAMSRAFDATAAACRALTHRYTTDKRAEPLLAELHKRLGRTFDRSDRKLARALEAEVCRKLFQVAGRAEHVGSETRAAWFRTLSTQAAKVLPEVDRLRLESELLASMATGIGDEWHMYQPSLAASLAGDDRDVLGALVTLYERTGCRPLQAWLADRLLARSQVRPPSPDDVAAVARALREALGIPAPGSLMAGGPDSRRLGEWRRVAAAALGSDQSRADADSALLDRTIRAACASSLATALAARDRTAGDSRFDELLTKMQLMPELPPADNAAASDRGPGNDPIALMRRGIVGRPALGGVPQPLVEQALLTLAPQSKRRALEDRTRALDLLALHVAAGGQLEPQFAEIAAGYLLSAKDPPEHAAILDCTGRLGQSRDLLLAVADVLADSGGGREQTPEVVAALLNQPAAKPAGALTWTEALRVQVLQHVIDDLRVTTAASSGGNPFDAAREALQKAYADQAVLLGVDPDRVKTLTAPSAALAAVIEHASGGARGGASIGRFTAAPNDAAAELRVAERAAGNSLERLVLLQRVWLRVLAAEAVARFPQRLAAAEAVVTGLLHADAQAAHVVRQLHDGEQAILKMWLIYHGQ